MAALSDIEKVRQENIKRNEAFLQELGFATSSTTTTTTSSASASTLMGEAKKRKSANGTAKAVDEEEYVDVPVRRSSRLDKSVKNIDGSLISSIVVDVGYLQQLVSMGFPSLHARKGLIYCDNSLERSLAWLETHKNDPDIDVDTVFHAFDSKPDMERVVKSRINKAESVPIAFDDESIDRNPITAASLRQFILGISPLDSEEISNEALQHCVFRIHTLSNKKLAIRVRGISTGRGDVSYEKLLVFYYALEHVGLQELATAAREALLRKYHREVGVKNINDDEVLVL